MKNLFTTLFITVSGLLFSLSLHAKNDIANPPPQEEVKISIVDMYIDFRPEKVHTYNIQNPVDIECPCYVKLTNKQLTLQLLSLGDLKKIKKNQNLYRTNNVSAILISKFSYTAKSTKNGGYQFNLYPEEEENFNMMFYFTLKFDQEGYGSVVINQKKGKYYYPLETYEGIFTYKIKEQTIVPEENDME